MSPMKGAWCALKMKNMQAGSHSDPWMGTMWQGKQPS